MRVRWVRFLFEMLGLALLIWFGQMQEDESPPRRPPLAVKTEIEMRRPPSYVGMLPPTVVENAPHGGPEINSSVGTAFATAQAGTWLTAHHVVNHCKNIFLRINAPQKSGRNYWLRSADDGKIPVVKAELAALATNADLAVLTTRYTPKSHLPLAEAALYEKPTAQEGFAIGFPGGKPGELTAQLMGTSLGSLRLSGHSFEQPLFVWAIERRNPESLTLGGISGGPLLNAYGEVVGVNTAGSDRRGRLLTSQPQPLTTMAPTPENKQSSEFADLINDDNFTMQAERLRTDYLIAQVICLK